MDHVLALGARDGHLAADHLAATGELAECRINTPETMHRLRHGQAGVFLACLLRNEGVEAAAEAASAYAEAFAATLCRRCDGIAEVPSGALH